MAENTQVAEKKEFTTALSRWSNEITGLIAKDYEACGVILMNIPENVLWRRSAAFTTS